MAASLFISEAEASKAEAESRAAVDAHSQALVAALVGLAAEGKGLVFLEKGSGPCTTGGYEEKGHKFIALEGNELVIENVYAGTDAFYTGELKVVNVPKRGSIDIRKAVSLPAVK